MSFVTAFPNSFKGELPRSIHSFVSNTGDLFNLALGVGQPSIDYGLNTTNYSDMTSHNDEVQGVGYTTGGFHWEVSQNISPQNVTSRTYWSWSVNPFFKNAFFSTSGCLIYNLSKGNKVVYVGSFRGIVSLANQDFTLVLPVNAPSTSILRLT